MFGRNPIRKYDAQGDGMLILQGVPWRTIQGEGPYAGLPATFVRLWGCHLHCTFCDTDFESDPQLTTIDVIQRACGGCELVVLTGGEPLRQNIAALCNRLGLAGHRVQIETAGSFPPPLQAAWWVDIVVSPKTPTVNTVIRDRAIAWKYIVSCFQQQDTDGLPITNTQGDGVPKPLAKPPTGIQPSRVYLQPMDECDADKNADNLRLCIKLAQMHGYRVSLQQHKIMGVL